MVSTKENIIIKDQLKADIEEVLGRKLTAPKDFQLLLDKLHKGTPLSMSTLKRLWGYVPNQHAARESTLNILAAFLGYEDWQHYCISHKDISESDFLSGINTIRDIQQGNILELEWEPDRLCRIQKTGDNRFTVIMVKKAKLQVGDEFSTTHIEIGEPLVATHFIRNGKRHPDYIAGKRKGLTAIKQIKNNKRS